jgi:hypothetical protein
MLRRFLSRVKDTFSESSANLLAGALIFFLYVISVKTAFLSAFFKSVLSEHLAPKSITLFIAISWLMWAVWAIAAAIWKPRYEHNIMLKVAKRLVGYDQFVVSLYSIAIGVYLMAFLAGITNLLSASNGSFRFLGVAALLFLLCLFIPSFWLQPDKSELPSMFEARGSSSKTIIIGNLVVALLLILTALYVIAMTIVEPIQFTFP